MIAKRKNEFADLEAFWEVLEVLTDDTQTKRVLGSGTISGFEASIINLPFFERTLRLPQLILRWLFLHLTLILFESFWPFAAFNAIISGSIVVFSLIFYKVVSAVSKSVRRYHFQIPYIANS